MFSVHRTSKCASLLKRFWILLSLMTALLLCGSLAETASAASTNSVPTITLGVSSSRGVRVKWSSVSGAEKYAIYRSENGNSYHLLSTTTDTAYTDVTASSTATLYRYRVAAYVGNSWSSKSDVKKAYSIGAVALKELSSQSSTSIQVSWEKNSNVTGYQIEYSTSASFTDSQRVTISNRSTTSKTLTGLKTGQTYYVRVRGVLTKSDRQYYTLWSSTGSATAQVPATEITRIRNKADGIRLTWTAVAGADEYQIYRSVDGGAFELVHTTSSTAWKDKSAHKNGTQYRYKIYVCQGSSRSSRSKIASCIYLRQGSLTLLTNASSGSSAGLTASWSKNAKSSGYQVEYSTAKDFSNSQRVKVSGYKTLSETITGLKANKNYYVRVRSYVTSGSKTYFSAWSDAGTTAAAIHNVDSSKLAPYGTRVYSMTDDGILVYWKRPENTTGYEIYRSYSGIDNYTLIGVVEGETDGTYPDLSYDNDARTIYYLVCAYWTDGNGNKVYSDYSDVITATYRTTLKLERSIIYMPSGTSRTIGAYYGWQSAHNVVWSSSDSSVVSVTQKGTVSALKKGTAVISCYSKESGETKKITITVDRTSDAQLSSTPSSRYQQASDGTWYNPNATQTNDAVLMLAGDLMCQGPQQRAALTDYGYDFSGSYEYVKPILATSDFAIGNLETLISPASSYACEEGYIDLKANCNAPARYLDAVRYAGFDALTLANNHNCDSGTYGILSTISEVDNYNFPHTGLFSSSSDDRGLLVDVNGIKVGVLAYVSPTTGYNQKDAGWPQETIDTMLNYYSAEKAAADIATLRERGAEYIIVYMHWGTKNYFTVRPSQKQQAQELADLGVDYIAGSHSHTVQPYAEITASDGRIVPCIYSMGDFNAHINQLAGNRDSVLIRIRLTRASDGSIQLVENNYIPFYTYTSLNQVGYVTVPLNSALNGGLTLYRGDAFYQRIVSEVGSKLTEFVGNLNARSAVLSAETADTFAANESALEAEETITETESGSLVEATLAEEAQSSTTDALSEESSPAEELSP